MHLFVRAVVLGMSGPDKLHRDTRTQPPHAQARQPQSAFATKGRAIVHPNHFRQTVTAENLPHHPTHSDIALIGQERHRQHKTTEQIAHGERFAALPIAPSVARATRSIRQSYRGLFLLEYCSEAPYKCEDACAPQFTAAA